MTISRRHLLKVAAVAPLAAPAPPAVAQSSASDTSWDGVRGMFDLAPDRVHMSAMLLTSHPAPVREAIERHRAALDRDPVGYLEANGERLTGASRQAAADYLGMSPAHVALTDSTTIGIGLIYTGLKLRAGQELLTTDEDYYVTHVALRHAAERSGATVRRIALHDGAAGASAEGMVARLRDAIRPETRLLALTWVHSNTGLKIPAGAIAAMLREVNADRAEDDTVLFGLDAVHGFGVETDGFFDLGADFVMAGCHKWLFGPRGTGIAAIGARGLRATRPTIPSFDDSEVFSDWYLGREIAEPNNGRRMTPGGFKPFEHRWALADAFALHARIGRRRIAARTHDLACRLKEALAEIDGVTVHTPRAPALSSGIVAFEVAGVPSDAVVGRLRARGIVGSVAPYPSALVRLTPSIRNTGAEVDRAAEAVRDSR